MIAQQENCGQAEKELGWAKQSYSSKQKALTDVLEWKKELENEIAIFAEKNTVKIDPSSEGFIGVDAEKRQQSCSVVLVILRLLVNMLDSPKRQLCKIGVRQ